MTVDFAPLLADGRKFPSPEFSMLPKSIGKSIKGNRPALVNANTSLRVSRARYGLAIIAKSELAPGSRVLLPAYHCPALVEPFFWAKCHVDFYPLNEDLTPLLEILTEKLKVADAMVFAPFFGFDRTAVGLGELAKQHNCLSIEDLAHNAHAKILRGDYGVTSLEKFYPVSSGGELLIADSISGTSAIECWQGYQMHPIKWAIRMLFDSCARKLGAELLKPTSLKRTFRYFNPACIGEPMTQKDIRQLKCQDHKQLAANRRKNYQLLDQYLCRSRIGRPLFKVLGPEDVPYVYPFLLDNPKSFDLIRNMAIPLYRWEEIWPSGCKTSNLYRSRLVQFPCHQDLTETDIELLIHKLQTVERKLW